jgi:D-alanyl-D-alanine dipeptidase
MIDQHNKHHQATHHINAIDALADFRIHTLKKSYKFVGHPVVSKVQNNCYRPRKYPSHS